MDFLGRSIAAASSSETSHIVEPVAIFQTREKKKEKSRTVVCEIPVRNIEKILLLSVDCVMQISKNDLGNF